MSKQTTYGVIAVLFIVSGATGLIYQIAWFKYLALFLGNTTYAQTVVLATFMGGLAIGSALWGPTADRREKPLALYGQLEVWIALFCFAYPFLLSAVRGWFVSFVAWTGWESGSGAVLALK